MLQNKPITLRSSPSARLSAQQNSVSRVHRYRSQVVLVHNSAQSPASQGSRFAPVPLNTTKKRVLPLLSELVEIQVCVALLNLAPGDLILS
jgi:hypothetical protein